MENSTTRCLKTQDAGMYFYYNYFRCTCKRNIPPLQAYNNVPTGAGDTATGRTGIKLACQEHGDKFALKTNVAFLYAIMHHELNQSS